jgi:hypothetical protein
MSCVPVQLWLKVQVDGHDCADGYSPDNCVHNLCWPQLLLLRKLFIHGTLQINASNIATSWLDGLEVVYVNDAVRCLLKQFWLSLYNCWWYIAGAVSGAPGESGTRRPAVTS